MIFYYVFDIIFLSIKGGVILIKYKVVKKIIMDENSRRDMGENSGSKEDYLFSIAKKYGFLCYKIIAGMYIFYITPDVYEQGVKEGIIEEIIEEPEVLNFDIMLCTRGMTVFHRMWYALEHSTIEYLRTELERVNKELGLLNVKIYSTSWYDKENEIRREEPELEFLDEVIVDLKNMVILKNTAREKKVTNIFKSTYFKHVSSYEGFLDALVMYQDRAFMNSCHIIDKFKDSDFYDVDYWMQRLNKFEFSLELK